MAESDTDQDTDLIEDVFKYLAENKYPENCNDSRKRTIRKKSLKFVLHKGVMYFKKKKKRGQVIELRFIRTRSEQLKVLKACHNDPIAGHMGVKKTINKISERFYWPGFVGDVKEMISSCDRCQKVNRKNITKKPELHCVPVKSPWFHIGIDFIAPINPTSIEGNSYILTICDYFTKFVEAIALPDKGAEGVAKSLFKVFMRMGIPRIVTSDNGREFKNKLDEELSKQLGIKRICTTPYHPQANKLVERYNQTLQNMIVKSYMRRRNCGTTFWTILMFGRKALLPIEIEVETASVNFSDENDFDEVILERTEERSQVLAAAKENILKAQEKQKETYDRKHACPNAFVEGEKVLMKDFKRKKRAGGKMDLRYTGPYVIVKSLSKGLYKLAEVADCDKIVERVNGAHLKAYNAPPESEATDKEENVISKTAKKHPVFPLKKKMFYIKSSKPAKKKRSTSWIPDVKLHFSERRILLSTTMWINSVFVNAVQQILRTDYPSVCGLQDTTRGITMEFSIEKGEFVQILHDGINYWLTISTIGVQHPEVEVYDSKYLYNISARAKKQIASLLHTDSREILLTYKDVQKQSVSSDCGLFAIATATALVLGHQPGEHIFDQSKMRSHLLQCLENKKMMMFPNKARREQSKDFTSSFEVYCICRMPEDDSLNWIQCSECEEWYHTDSCIEVSSCYFEPGKKWLCTKCEMATDDQELSDFAAENFLCATEIGEIHNDHESSAKSDSDESSCAFVELKSLDSVSIPSEYIFPKFTDDHSDSSDAVIDLFEEQRSIKQIWLDVARSHFRQCAPIKSDSDCLFKRDMIRQVVKSNEAVWRGIINDTRISAYTIHPSKKERCKTATYWPLELPDMGSEVEMYLKALQSDEWKKKSITGLHIAQYILRPEAMILLIATRFEVTKEEAKQSYDNQDLTPVLANYIAQ